MELRLPIYEGGRELGRWQPHAGSPGFSESRLPLRSEPEVGEAFAFNTSFSLFFFSFPSLVREGSKEVEACHVTVPNSKSNVLTVSFWPKPTKLVTNLREGSFLSRTELHTCQSRIIASCKCTEPSLLLQEKPVCIFDRERINK